MLQAVSELCPRLSTFIRRGTIARGTMDGTYARSLSSRRHFGVAEGQNLQEAEGELYCDLFALASLTWRSTIQLIASKTCMPRLPLVYSQTRLSARIM